jgi:hypothetical protein
MLFVELAKVEDGWLWRSDRTGNKPELELGCFGKFVGERAKGRMENTNCEAMANALCGSVLWMMITVVAGWSLAPFFFDSWNMGLSFVRWLVSLPWYMQHGCLNVYGPRQLFRPGMPPL